MAGNPGLEPAPKKNLVAGGSYLIDPLGHKKAQKTQKIYNKSKGGSGSEKDWIKKTGPQLPQV